MGNFQIEQEGAFEQHLKRPVLTIFAFTWVQFHARAFIIANVMSQAQRMLNSTFREKCLVLIGESTRSSIG